MNLAKKTLSFGVILSFFSPVTFVFAGPLSLEDYLGQVENQSLAVRASALSTEGAALSHAEGRLQFAPRFSLSVMRTMDQREQASPLFSNIQTYANTVQAGLEKNFDFGLSSKLTYTYTNSRGFGYPNNFVSSGAFIFGLSGAELTLSQSLWRNFLGREFRASAQIAESGARAVQLQDKLKLAQNRANAEVAYYRLALAREAVKQQEELIASARRSADWARTRVNTQLSDRIDVMQTTAALRARELELQIRRDEERSARLEFNTYRNIAGDRVNESLPPFQAQSLMKLKAPARAQETLDVKVQRENAKIQSANHELAVQRQTPDVSVFGSVGNNGFDRDASQAFRESMTVANPYVAVGLKLTVPLSVADAADVRAGRTKQQLATEAQADLADLQSAQNYHDLSARLSTAQNRLENIIGLVQLQKEKVDYEKRRLALGRTTTYQVLTFEQDYAQSLLNQTSLESEIIRLYAQLKTLSLGDEIQP